MTRMFLYLGLIISFGCSGKRPIERSKQLNENEIEVSVSNQSEKSSLEKRNQKKQQFKIDTISETEFNSLLKGAHKNLLDTTKLFSFKLNGIVKVLNSSKRVVREYSDSLADSDDTDQRLFRIKGQYDEIKTTILTVQYYESGECLLVNNETGKETKVIGIPKLSKDHKFMFSCSIALGYDVMPTGFQIWEIDNKNQFKLLHEVQTKIWGINDFYWIDDRTLILEARNIYSSKYYLKLTF